MMHRNLALAVAVGLTVSLAACGTTADEGGAPDATETATQPGTSPTDGGTDAAAGGVPEIEGPVNERGTASVTDGAISVDAGDLFFDPTYIEAEPGTTVEVEVANVGAVSHTFTIDDQDINVVLNVGDDPATVQVEVGESGSVVFFCRFHRSQGMKGAFFTG